MVKLLEAHTHAEESRLKRVSAKAISAKSAIFQELSTASLSAHGEKASGPQAVLKRSREE
jgi:hypothetical protein